MSAHGWIGVDLDGTLAEYSGWVSETHIGAPIPAMVERVKRWRAEGKDVRIFTARASKIPPAPDDDRDEYDREGAVQAIQAWCLDHLGEVLPITCMKDYLMVELWDDRAVQVIPNTGRAFRDIPLEEFVASYAAERRCHMLPVSDDLVDEMQDWSGPVEMKLTTLDHRLLDATIRTVPVEEAA